MFAKLYEGLRLMSDLLWPTAAAADCPGLHVPAHPCSLHVYLCVCAFCIQVTADPLRVKEQEKITPVNLFEHLQSQVSAFVWFHVYLSIRIQCRQNAE